MIVTTAGARNVIDATLGESNAFELIHGTINTWIIVNSNSTQQAFLQAIVTATESKTFALHELNVLDQQTNTLATGTSTDSILVAATQTGHNLEFAGPITPLGSKIGTSVH